MNNRSGKVTPLKRGLEIEYLFADESDMDGAIQVEYRGSSANDEFIGSRHSGCSIDESEFASPVADDASPPLVRLPPSPFRSLGGYFSYEEWPDQQRFMELDEALRRKAFENFHAASRRHSQGAGARGPIG
jgi:hypothetical protein